MALECSWQEWEIPREAGEPWPSESRSLFNELQSEQAKGRDARPRKIADWLLAYKQEPQAQASRIETLPDAQLIRGPKWRPSCTPIGGRLVLLDSRR